MILVENGPVPPDLGRHRSTTLTLHCDRVSYYSVEILDRDARSNPNGAVELAGELIQNENVHLVIPASTTDIGLPVAEQAELFGTPCISSTAPWQAIIMPRGGINKTFDWSYHFFWGLEDIIATFINIWRGVDTNRKVGLILPRNVDGEIWGDKKKGFPPAMLENGFEVIAPSLYQPRTNDFSSQIAAFPRGRMRNPRGSRLSCGFAHPH